ncbi:MAG: hypothetical protein ABJE95_36305 [Byssovorax sp.]
MKYRRLLAALTVATFLVPSRAEADPSDADRVAARALAADAHHAVDAKDYATAAERFARADALVHAPTLMLGLARARVELGQLVAARDVYAQILQEDLPATSPKSFFEAVELARTELAALAPRMAWVTLTVSGTANAKVVLDGIALPSDAIGVRRAVDPGKHVVTATGAEGGRAEATVTVGEGKTEAVTLELKLPAPEPAVVPLAVPAPAAKPEVTPVAPLTSPPPVALVTPAPEPKTSARKTVAVASLSVGAAGLVLGGVMGGLVLNLHGTLAEGCPKGRCPASLVPKLDSYNTFGLVSTVGFLAGGALAGVGVVLLATAAKNDEARVGLTVSPTSGGGMLGAVGRF